MQIPFHLVDVFAEQKYAGNQLAIFRSGALNAEEMQQIALETRLSETTFILSDRAQNGGFDVRIFTPQQELPFAGHPTLGTAFVIQQNILGEMVDRVILNLAVGQIPVQFTYRDDQPEMLWMQQKTPKFGAIVDHAKLASALNVTPQDIDDRFPIQVVSTGVPFLIAPLRNRASVVRAYVRRDRLANLLEEYDAHGVLIFAPEPYHSTNHLNARALFAGLLESSEDPATGSANGCLAGYLSHHRFFEDADVDIRVEQGFEMKRPSILHLRSSQRDNQIDVHVGGNVIAVAQGFWMH